MLKKFFRCRGRADIVRKFLEKILSYGIRPIEVRVVNGLHEVVLSEEAFEFIKCMCEKDVELKETFTQIWTLPAVIELPTSYTVTSPVFETFHITLTPDDVGKEISVTLVEEGEYTLINITQYADIEYVLNANYLIFGKALVLWVFAEPKPDMSIPDTIQFTFKPPKFDIKCIKLGRVVKLFNEFITKYGDVLNLESYQVSIDGKLKDLTQNVFTTHTTQFIVPKYVGYTTVGLVIPINVFHSWRNILREIFIYFTEPISAPIEICLDTSSMEFSCGDVNCWDYINKLHIVGDVTLFKSVSGRIL